MPKWIIFVNVGIIIFKIVLTAIIRRVNVDYIHFARVSI